MNTNLVPESAMLNALRDGPASIAEIAKSADADKEDVEATLEDFGRRQLAERDNEASTSKTDRWRLTQLGRNTVQARYPD